MLCHIVQLVCSGVLDLSGDVLVSTIVKFVRDKSGMFSLNMYNLR